MYQPLRVFFYIGVMLMFGGMIPSLRFLYYYLQGDGTGHIQSLILASILIIVGFQVIVIGLVADVISFNRHLIEDILVRIKKLQMDPHDENPSGETLKK